MKTALRHLARYLAVVAVLFLAWKAAASTLSGGVLPQPEDAVAAFLRDMTRSAYWGHVRASTKRACWAMALAWGVGFPLGILMGSRRGVDAALGPFVILTYPVPKIVLLPVFLLLLGLGDAAKVSMIALILGYQVLVTTRDGARGVNPKYVDTVRSLGGGYGQVLRHVLLPAALPHGFTALRLNTGVSVAVLFFVESFATTRGLGYYIMDSWGRLDYPAMFSGIFGMSGLGVALYETVNAMERRACRWRHEREAKS